MRIAVLGSGGVGGYFGAKLARGGADVTFLARGVHREAIQQDGLRIEGGDDPFHLPDVHATSEPGEVGPVDLVMVCVKLWDTESALRQARPLLGPDSTVVSFQNGVGKDAGLRATYDESHLIGGVAYIATRIKRPGVIVRTGSLERLVFGEYDGHGSARVDALHSACLAGGITAEISTDIEREIWEKFVFLVGLSATTATMRRPIGPIRANPQTRGFLLDLMREVVAVGQAQGVQLPGNYAEHALALMDEVPADMTSSMHHDLQQGNPLEAPWLSGSVVELGEQVGLDAPLNRAVADILCLAAGGNRI